jgi:hypothetical protein
MRAFEPFERTARNDRKAGQMTSRTRRIRGRLLLLGALTLVGGLLPAVPALGAGPTSHQVEDGAMASAVPSTPKLPVCRPPDCRYA